MKAIIKKPFPTALCLRALLVLAVCVSCATPTRAENKVSQVPLFLTTPTPPIAIIDLPKDQSLFQKAYTDYSDLDGDGMIDSTYDNDIQYTGYFDSGVCYKYSGGKFSPSSLADIDASNGKPRIDGDGKPVTTHYCKGAWSGNLLNWITMSRMDIVRSILYGGKRSVDSSEETVLERANLPDDAHAWAKFLDGDHIAQLTPYDGVNTTIQYVKGTAKNKESKSLPRHFSDKGCQNGSYAKRKYTVDTNMFYAGDQLKLYPGTKQMDNPKHGYMIAGVCSVNKDSITVRIDSHGVFPKGNSSYRDKNWIIENLTQVGITFCNVTPGKDGTNSQGNDNAPEMRVAQGNYALWSASSLVQCQWTSNVNGVPGRKNTMGGFEGLGSNGNDAAASHIDASAENADPKKPGSTSFKVEVEACVQGYIVNQTCTKYPDGNYKPTGLLQKYGDSGNIHFGLFTGTYNKNFSGGVLRANAASFANEDNVNSDGRFTSHKGIVYTLDHMRIFGFNYGGSGAQYVTGDNCTYQITEPLKHEGHCRSWGNPMSEIYLESLRYLAGKNANPAFKPSRTVLGLVTANWQDPLNNKNYCAPLDVLVFNTSTANFDDDQMGGISDIEPSGETESANALTDKIGQYEGISGHKWFIGNTSDNANSLCSAKTVNNFGDIFGLCPGAPSMHGSFLMAGTAWEAHTQRIRSDLKNVPAKDEDSLKVKTYGVQLASGTPNIPIETQHGTVTLIPAYRLDCSSGCNSNDTQPGTGALVDFKVIKQTQNSGEFYANWEDSNQGGDYDQDMWGVISYQVHGDEITVSTDAIAESSSNGQGFGYIISGTDHDGPHFVSGFSGFNYSDPTGVTGCDNCNIRDPAVSVTYKINGNSANSLQPPLYYAAKYGGFTEQNGSDPARPDEQLEWDTDNDGLPDNYFLATNPLRLKSALDGALQGVANQEASATAITANSTTLTGTSSIYQARFKSGDWYGQLFAYPLDSDGKADATPSWDAAKKLNERTTARNIYTWVPTPSSTSLPTPTTTGGVAFAWDNLSGSQKAALNTIDDNGKPKTDNLGEARLAWLKGDRSTETQNGGDFRDRIYLLGDIVNSTPTYVGDQDYRYYLLPYSGGTPSNEVSSYENDFRGGSAYQGRAKVLYVGANDGMLHAFDADSGDELFAYVPNAVYPNLSALTQHDYGLNHHFFVDGLTHAGDAYFDSKWHTVLVGGLGADGKGIYALDVSDISSSSSFSSSDVLWEYDAGKESANDKNLGYTFGKPTIVRLADGNWYAIFGNGYDSENGGAALYLIRLDATKFDTTTVITKVVKPNESACVNNGLSAVTPIDTDGDRVTDYAYAGDLCGNIWQFDLSSPTSISARKVFTATSPDGDPQPITERVAVGSDYVGHCCMVYFGTGKYFANGDNSVSDDNLVNSFYAIRDQGSETTISRDDLQQESIIKEQIISDTPTRVVSKIKTDYDGGKKGWYLNLVKADGTVEGERVVAEPILRNGRIIVTTLIPEPKDMPCQAGGTGWLMEMDALDGGRLNETVLDVNGDDQFDENDDADTKDWDTPVSGVKPGNGIPSDPAIISSPPKEYKYVQTSSGSRTRITEKSGGKYGRQSWREIQ
jgi:type IV pilus assembly protein PilY1